MELLKKIYNRLHYEWYIKPVNRRFEKAAKEKLHNKNFSIIGSNCLAGFIYQHTGVEYLSPTAGLFFNAPCYVELVKNLKENLQAPVVEIKESKYPSANEKRKARNTYYPIGLLNNTIEIHFLHYPTFEAAMEKWNRRCARINFDNVLLLFCEIDNCTPENIAAFNSVNIPGKVVFTANSYPGLAAAVQLKKYKNAAEVGGADKIWTDVVKEFDIINWLNQNKK